jgi:EAL domain-containing protein (putative c-di-GMP-specific phosphodiesterase class I)
LTGVLDVMLRGDTSSTLFQPIYDVEGERFEVWAVEALTRGPAGTHFEPAPIFFDYVRLKREEVRVDRWCIASAFVRHASLNTSTHLSVNVHASTLERDPSFASFVESAAVTSDIDPAVLIIEIVEHSPYFDSSRILRALRDLRSLGAAIAIDDVGAGHANFRTILDAEPEYLKLDRYFVAGAAGDTLRQALIASTVQIARDFGALIIGEGVDDPADLIVLRDMNVPLVQGYLLAMPEARPSLAPVDVARLLRSGPPCDLERSEP